jgi:hypothetical protein
MIENGAHNVDFGADRFGFRDLAAINWNLGAPQLYEHALQWNEARIAAHGPLVADTGAHTGRSPKDKFVVRDANTEATVWWENNNAMTVEHFDVLLADFLAHPNGKTLFAQDLYGGADPAFRLRTRVFTEYAWHSLFIRNLLIRPPVEELANFVPELGLATEGRFGETLSQATVVRGILPYISDDPVGDRDRGRRFAYWEPATAKEFGSRIFYPFFQKNEDQKILAVLMNYFLSIRDRWPIAWNSTGQGNIINRTNGFNGFMRFLKPSYLRYTTEPNVVPKASFDSLFARMKLEDGDFTVETFPPGTGGSSKLFRTLQEQAEFDAG